MPSEHGSGFQPPFIGAIDQGTTSTRFIIFDTKGRPVASHQLEFKQYYPHPGYHEQDPHEIFSSVEECIAAATEPFTSQGHSLSSISAIGLTTQRETIILWDDLTGEIFHPAIAWPDTRTTALVRELKNCPGADRLPRICGVPLSTYPSAVKLIWLLRNVESVRKAYEEGRLVFGTVDSWLLWCLNGKGRIGPSAEGKGERERRGLHVTDVTNASRTMFVDLEALKYCDEVFEFFGIERGKVRWPRIVPNSDEEAFGKMASGPLQGVRITGCLGDQSSALVGQLAFSPGQAKNTYGTGCFLLCNVGEKPVFSSHGLLATVGYQFGDRDPIYALEGSIAVAGSAVKFLQKNLNFIEASHHVSDLAATVEDNGGCVFVTAFSGLFAPYWIDDARGTIFGITPHTQKGHLARATLEATCYQAKAILDAMEKDSGRRLTILAVDGGMTNSDLCMQTQADIIGLPVDRPFMRETTSLGAAIAAGLAAGVWKNFDELKGLNMEDRTVFEPKLSKEESLKMYRRWERAVEMSRGWTADEEAPE